MEKEIIVVKQLPVIQEQLETIKVNVQKRVDEALSLVCTEDTVKAVKSARTELGKEFKAWEEKRKQVKVAIMSPYEQFEAIYKDCISNTFKKADAELKSKIDAVEDELKEQKRANVQEYFNEYLESKNIPIAFTLENVNLNITLSASLKSLKEQVKTFIDKVCDDLALIETQEHKEEILYEYKRFLNVSAAITTVVNRYKAIEEAKAREAERLAKIEAEQNAVQKVEEVVETLSAPVEEEKILTLNFTVKATKSKLIELKKFLNQGGYEYE